MLCEYHVRDDGIHEFILHRASHAAVDELIAALKLMRRTTPPDVLRYVLIDSSVGLQPLNHLFWNLRQMGNETPRHKGSCVAVIVHSSFMTKMIGGMLRAYPQVNIRFFQKDERDAALAWLCAR